jgi:membrane-bound serine protease (ClpP class)
MQRTNRPRTRVFILISALSLLNFQLDRASAQAEKREADGVFISVGSPITESVVNHLQADVKRARESKDRLIKTIIFDFNPDGKEVSTKEYGPCLSLTDFIRSLSNDGLKTVAYVRSAVTGHAVLPAIACEDLIMTGNGRIGGVIEKDRTPLRRELEEYASVAGEARAPFVIKMLDKNAEIMTGLRGQTPIYIQGKRRNDPEYKDLRNLRNVPDFSPGVIELFTTQRALKFGLAKSQKDTREEVVQLYGLSPASLRPDALQGRTPKAVSISIFNSIDVPLRESLKRRFAEASSNEVTTIFLVISDCNGGDVSVANEIAEMIRNLRDKDNNPIRTVAFVTGKAADLAIFPALACSEIVMFKSAGDEASLGDFRNFLQALKARRDEAEVRDQLARLLRNLLEDQSYPPIIADALLDNDSKLVRVQNVKQGTRKVVLAKDVDALGEDFRQEATIKDQGTLLILTPDQAKDLRISGTIVESKELDKLVVNYGFDSKQVVELKEHWLDAFSKILRREEVTILLLLIGVFGLVLELKVPGMTVPGIISAICFVLFFWSRSFNGDIILLSVLMFLLGIVFIGVEIFILPGFGIMGLTGILLLLLGLGLATVDRLPSNTQEGIDLLGKVVEFGLAVVFATAMTFVVARFLPSLPGTNRLMLVPPTEDSLNDPISILPGAGQAARMLGKTGTAISVLRPAGSAQFGDEIIDVVSEGDFIGLGSSIQVIEVEGNRIVVKAI